MVMYIVLVLKQKTANVRRIRYWSSDVCSSDLVVHDWASMYHESQADREEDTDLHRLDNTEMRLRSIDWGPQQVDSSTRHGDEDRQTGEDDQSDERPRRRRNTFLEAE